MPGKMMRTAFEGTVVIEGFICPVLPTYGALC